MKELALSLFKDNGDLADYASRRGNLRNAAQRRGLVSIAVIDDEAFAPQSNLASYGYRITPLGDIRDIADVAKYQIVLCDIIGVGRFFDASIQGASLIAEIKRSYPEKVVIAYTGAAMNDRSARIATARADRILRKDAPIEDWIELLDEMSKEATDPHVIWNKIRSRFVEMGISSKDVLMLEDAYVRDVKSGAARLSNLSSTAQSSGIQQDARAIIQGLISSMIFEAITSA